VKVRDAAREVSNAAVAGHWFRLGGAQRRRLSRHGLCNNAPSTHSLRWQWDRYQGEKVVVDGGKCFISPSESTGGHRGDSVAHGPPQESFRAGCVAADHILDTIGRPWLQKTTAVSAWPWSYCTQSSLVYRSENEEMHVDPTLAAGTRTRQPDARGVTKNCRHNACC
jgi:hypothetical protein